MANYHKPGVGKNKKIGVPDSSAKSKRGTLGAARGAVTKTAMKGKEAGGMKAGRMGKKPTLKGNKFKLQKGNI